MILRVAGLFVLLALLVRLSRGTMWVAFVVTALAAGPLLGLGWHESVRTLWAAASSVSTLRLLLFVESIILMSGLMRRTGALARLGEAVCSALGSARGGVALLPALVGLLPMPGGALFSAPLVDAAAAGSGIDATRRAVANYWFRHTWEFWWPLYPGIIAAVELSGIPWSTWTARLFLLTPVAALMGWVLILHRPGGDRLSHDSRAWNPLAREMAPILLIPALAALSHGASRLWPAWRPDGTWVLFACVWASIGLVLMQGRVRPREIARACNRRMASMGVLIVALMAYKGIIVDSGMADQLQREFALSRLPALPIASAVACVGGLVTGIAVGFVGSTFPIVASLLAASSLGFECAMAVAFLWGWVGMMLSPLHLCLLVSREHFRADWLRMYRLLVPLTVLTALIGTMGLVTFGRKSRPSPGQASAAVGVAAAVRQRNVDRIVTFTHPGGAARAIPRTARQQRWPSYAPNGEYLAYGEGDRLWNLVVLAKGGHRVAVAESLTGDRVWAAWSFDSRRLAASGVTLAWGRCILRWETGSTRAEVLPSALNARCPFWKDDTLGYFVPLGETWALCRLDPGAGPTVWWELPEPDPAECRLSPDGKRLAYLAGARDEQPPRLRAFTVDLSTGEVREVGGRGEETIGLAWQGDDLLCFTPAGSMRHLVRIAPDGTHTIVATVSDRLVGVQIVPERHTIVGVARRAVGRRWEMVIARWDGSPPLRMKARRGDLWGISAVALAAGKAS